MVDGGRRREDRNQKRTRKAETKKKDKPRELASTAQLEGFDNWATSVLFSPDGKTLLVGSHNKVHAWDVGLASRRRPGRRVPGTCGRSHFCREGRRSSSAPYSVGFGVGRREPARRNVTAEASRIRDVGWRFLRTASLLATACEDEAARLIRIEDGSLLRTIAHDRSRCWAWRFPPNGKLLATASGDDTRVTQSGGARLWNAETGELVRAF